MLVFLTLTLNEKIGAKTIEIIRVICSDTIYCERTMICTKLDIKNAQCLSETYIREVGTS